MPPPLNFARRDLQNRYPAIRSLWQINKYLWMTLGFLLVYTVVAEAQGLVRVSMAQAWMLFILALTSAVTRTLLAWRKAGVLSDTMARVFTAVDVFLVALGIHFTGGLQSDLWLVYFVVIIFELMFATLPQKRLVIFSVCIAYLCATLPTQLAVLPPVQTFPAYLRILASRFFFLIIVGSLSRRISRNALDHDRELSLLREQMATSEERARIAREVHDGLGHSLVSVILRLELCQRLLKRVPDEASTLLREEIVSLRSAWNESRDLAFHLHPWEKQTTTESLPDTLRRHLSRFAERTGVNAKLTVEEPLRPLAPDAILGLIRIVQEALTNAAKHAQATQIEVSLLSSPTSSFLHCTITDDGVGFDPAGHPAGLGLETMRQRAEGLGGGVQYTSSPGNGVRIEVRLPG
ncbi:MAG: response regulator receiver sensor signal transduction histidine kinase [Chthonomonadales bacterium]|nr:response regulator receiver sensor signal transduction histidine kinase [Chthonomonadales bacterium]